MITTMIEREDGTTITHTGEAGITITGKRDATKSGLDALIEVGSDISSDELVATIGTLMTFLEERFGERFIAKCMAHYADETGKKYLEEGGNKLFMIRGKEKRR